MRVARWMLVMAGTATMAYAALVLAPDARFSKVGKVIPWLVGSALAHDAVVAPIVFVFAALVVSRIPTPYRRAVQGGLFAAAVVTLFSFPFLRGYGKQDDLPSALPLNYARGLVIVLAVIAVMTLAAVFRSSRSARGTVARGGSRRE